jgi:hypothetical protein
MLSKLALLVAGFVLLTETATLAAPPARENGDDATIITLSLTTPSSYVPVSVQPSAFAPEITKDLPVRDR